MGRKVGIFDQVAVFVNADSHKRFVAVLDFSVYLDGRARRIGGIGHIRLFKRRFGNFAGFVIGLISEMISGLAGVGVGIVRIGKCNMRLDVFC